MSVDESKDIGAGPQEKSPLPLMMPLEPLGTLPAVNHLRKYDVEVSDRRGSASSSEAGSAAFEKHDVEKQPVEIPVDMSELKKSETAASEAGHVHGKQLAAVIIALFMAVFLVALDRLIIATAIPKITDEFHSLNDVGWYASAFLITSGCFQLVLGRVYTFYKPKTVFLIIIVVFEVGSAICGAAPNSTAFILGRAIAGVGAAGIQSGGIIIMVGAIPLEKRPAFQGLFGAVFGVASVAGPLLGGVFTSDVSWRWCFYINLPIGAVTFLIILFILKPTEPLQKAVTIRHQLLQLDLLGQGLLLPCIISLLLALQWGGSTYPWSNGRIIALFVVFGVLFIAFVLSQVLRTENVTIPGRIVRNRSIIAGVWYTFCLAATMMVAVYYLPIWFQAIKGVSAIESGIRTIPLVLALVFGAISSGQIVGKIGYYKPFLILSAILVPIGTGLLTTFKVNTGEGAWFGYQVLLGFGIGLGMQQANIAAQTVLPKRDVPTGVSLIFFAQLIGGAIFVPVGQNVFDSHLVKSLSKFAGSTHFKPSSVVNTGATELRKLLPTADLNEALVAYNSALRQAFIVATIMACLMIFGAVGIEWRSVKKGQPDERPKLAKDGISAEAPKEEV